MKVFDKFDDIDFEWVKAQENVDYGYKGEFSSKYFIEELDSIIKKEG